MTKKKCLLTTESHMAQINSPRAPDDVHKHGPITVQQLAILFDNLGHVSRMVADEVRQSFHQRRGWVCQRKELQKLGDVMSFAKVRGGRGINTGGPTQYIVSPDLSKITNV